MMEREIKRLLWGLVILLVVALGVGILYWRGFLSPYGKLNKLLSKQSLERVNRLAEGRSFYWVLLDSGGRVITASKGTESPPHPELLQVRTKDGEQAYLRLYFGQPHRLSLWLFLPFIFNFVLLVGLFCYAFILTRRIKASRRETEMREHLAYLGKLSRGLTHELRNPLNTIMMNLQMIAEDIPAEPHQLKRLERIKRELKRLEDNLTSFLRFARPPELRLRREELNEVVQHTADFFLPECRSAGIELSLELGHGLPRVLIDRRQIEQALLNLLLNAKLFTSKAGKITIRTGEENNKPYISISDTGKGIPKEELPHLFSPYYTRRKGGSGVGLALVKRIMEEHGGSIRVMSKPGEGTVFTLYLPRA